ncbi:Ovarian tumor otubain [Lasiodiplodia theobromae]|uniref:Ubiquitin thioesterase otu1 n=1 Tax=Lasiodiplodia theobromae TaxID=45133 RepID=UPI0015C3AFC0|nr:Ubiquitin thioesterase otu1 [Lasiodiplodia theobromae]KAF4539488.1 Ubiquitin thioesterase otu1 [Lasiodiplodia theobromae]KAF9639302.1 Ovarian tumor otubain [Lasiodiplodia theobromae]
MRIRVRGPSGVTTITLEEHATVAELQSTIAEKSGVPVFDLKYGYPPQPLDISQFDPVIALSDTGLKLNGEQLVVVPRDVGGQLAHPMADSTPGPVAALPGSQQARENQESGLQKPLSLSRNARDVESDPPEVAVPEADGTLILRVMPDDNSCLFRAVGSAVLGEGIDAMRELRGIVASAVQNNPIDYNEAVLQKSPDDYCRWIQRDDSWGGEIELNILSQHFGIEICSIDVQSLHVYRYNEGKPKRCILVYSGIHYDTIALNPSSPPHTKADMPPEVDIKQFDSIDDVILTKALELCQILQNRHYFTDTAGFAIRCQDCGWTGNGESSALEHAKKTGHSNFGEAE